MGRKLLDIVKSGCLIFTIITLVFYTFWYAVNKGTLGNLTINFIWMFFAFSLLVSFVNTLLYNKKMHLLVRFAIHFVCTAAAYFVCVIAACGFIENGSQTLVAFFVFVVVYVISAVIAGIYISKKEKANKDKKGYSSQFSK